MPQTAKIATCCYCGTRAALVLRGEGRHELACSTCGAPLHELKMLRADPARPKHRPRPAPVRHHAAPPPRKQGRSLSQRLMHKVWDAAEDLIDEIFD
ncbi:hypothetical protein EF888_13125 [Silicimonas algicola]|uniref:Uncharacterized protein n=1 Tax=Silicimonas algicola TaxID=1826607 RepID=A0A316G9I8_9RHOB|nr:hypothetical protein [Silicimonas algicola]AZQ67993.1 hypothetical protein EF888_13125 [Silicimonas algicola]PWK57564.1 hypothetical protein C8D95_102209 [Silicimonas algicola]